ncbi:MAG: YkgJ family cysteine cluster protein [Xanthomonadales bacterium]|nr:YkgJ family cysteine cluster protein [Xanthomonadales bacterium]
MRPDGRGGWKCRTACAACCSAPSISTPMPGHPHGKPAGTPCANLLPDLRCALFGRPERPPVCSSLKPQPEMCGDGRVAALAHLDALERATSTGGAAPGAAVC